MFCIETSVGLVQGGQKILEEVPKAKDDNVKPVEVPPNNNNNIAGNFRHLVLKVFFV